MAGMNSDDLRKFIYDKWACETLTNAYETANVNVETEAEKQGDPEVNNAIDEQIKKLRDKGIA